MRGLLSAGPAALVLVSGVAVCEKASAVCEFKGEKLVKKACDLLQNDKPDFVMFSHKASPTKVSDFVMVSEHQRPAGKVVKSGRVVKHVIRQRKKTKTHKSQKKEFEIKVENVDWQRLMTSLKHTQWLMSRAKTTEKALLKEYQRFLELKILNEDFDAKTMSPSFVIDQVWHMHVLDSAHYAEDMLKLQEGRPHPRVVQHNPLGAYDRDGEKSRRLENTRRLYKERYGDIAPWHKLIWADKLPREPRNLRNKCNKRPKIIDQTSETSTEPIRKCCKKPSKQSQKPMPIVVQPCAFIGPKSKTSSEPPSIESC